MMHLPEEWELLEVFQSDPALLDPGVPWAYNTLTFETTRGSDRIRCEISPGYEEVTLAWNRGSEELVNLKLCRIVGLAVSNESDRVTISFEFADGSIGPLEMHLKPAVQITFATH